MTRRRRPTLPPELHRAAVELRHLDVHHPDGIVTEVDPRWEQVDPDARTEQDERRQRDHVRLFRGLRTAVDYLLYGLQIVWRDLADTRAEVRALRERPQVLQRVLLRIEGGGLSAAAAAVATVALVIATVALASATAALVALVRFHRPSLLEFGGHW